MTTFYTADLHLGHTNIIRHCDRPFDTVEAMDRAIIDNWNRVVGDEDEVWVLGDVCLDKRKLVLVKELRGRKRLVAGNHDLCHRMHSKWIKYEGLYLDAGFDYVYSHGVYRHHYLTDAMSMRYAVDLAHLPYQGDSHDEDRFTEWRPRDLGRVLLCGHVHEAWKTAGHQINVGVDVWGFTPVSATALLPLVRAAQAEISISSLHRDLDRLEAEGSAQVMDGDDRARPA